MIIIWTIYFYLRILEELTKKLKLLKKEKEDLIKLQKEILKWQKSQ